MDIQKDTLRIPKPEHRHISADYFGAENRTSRRTTVADHRDSVDESEHVAEAQTETLSEVLADERSRAIVEALAANDGELHVAELADEVVKREQGDDRSAIEAVPPRVYTLVSGGGLVSIIGSYFEIGAFAALSVTAWIRVVFGLLLALSVYAVIAQRRS